MSAWMFTILRNLFRSEYRKRRREVGEHRQLLCGKPQIASRAGQPPSMFRNSARRSRKLPPDQREALILVGASGFSYEEAANICGCAVGTIKSRVNRARTRLADLLAIEGSEDFGPDQSTRAIMAAGGRG